MQLVVFTPPGPPGPHELRQANAMLHQGLKCLHLRKPSWPGVDNLASYLDQLEPQFHSRIVVHQHHELQRSYQLKGIHYREADRPQPPLPALPHTCSQSTSFHSLEDMQQDWQHLTYAFLSPIFDSISKPGYLAAGFDAGRLILTLNELPFDVIALGGITPDNAKQAHDMGFAGVAVLGSVWSAEDPVQAYERIQSACSSIACRPR